MDNKRLKSAQTLLDAAHEFWQACHSEGQYGAVQWLTGTDGELVIFTRGEYRDQLMRNIGILSDLERVHKFKGEEMPGEDDDSAPSCQ